MQAAAFCYGSVELVWPSKAESVMNGDNLRVGLIHRSIRFSADVVPNISFHHPDFAGDGGPFTSA